MTPAPQLPPPNNRNDELIQMLLDTGLSHSGICFLNDNVNIDNLLNVEELTGI